MGRIAVLAIGLLLAPLGAAAQSVVADLSQNRVSITSGFKGSEIVVFGAITPEDPSAEALDVIVAISGPLEPVTVRRKERVAGIWVNTDFVEIDAAPTLYEVATTRPLGEILSETEDLRHRITIPRAIRSVGAPASITDSQNFVDAIIRIRSREGLYRVQEGAVTMIGTTLFRANIALPANLVEGDYSARVFLARDRQVLAEFESELGVRKVGLERWIYTLAHENPLIYGLLSLAIAIAAGWSASAVFRYLRG